MTLTLLVAACVVTLPATLTVVTVVQTVAAYNHARLSLSAATLRGSAAHWWRHPGIPRDQMTATHITVQCYCNFTATVCHFSPAVWHSLPITGLKCPSQTVFSSAGWANSVALLAYLMYLYDLTLQTPRRLTYHQPVKHLPCVTRDLHYANHVI